MNENGDIVATAGDPSAMPAWFWITLLIITLVILGYHVVKDISATKRIERKAYELAQEPWYDEARRKANEV